MSDKTPNTLPTLSRSDQWFVEESLYSAGIEPDSISTILNHLPRIVEALLDLGYSVPVLNPEL